MLREARNGASTGTLNSEWQKVQRDRDPQSPFSYSQHPAMCLARSRFNYMTETELTTVHWRSTPLKWKAAHSAKLAKAPVFITWRWHWDSKERLLSRELLHWWYIVADLTVIPPFWVLVDWTVRSNKYIEHTEYLRTAFQGRPRAHCDPWSDLQGSHRQGGAGISLTTRWESRVSTLSLYSRPGKEGILTADFRLPSNWHGSPFFFFPHSRFN